MRFAPLLTVISLLVGCAKPAPLVEQDAAPVVKVEPLKEHEFTTFMFCRADQPKEQCAQPTCFREDKGAVLVGLEAKGWEYVGPLNANSLNCAEVAFRRVVKKP
jgi:hypothetical protein